MVNILELLSTTSELGLMTAITVLALFLSYLMLNVCDLSTDGCFTLGAVVGAVITYMGHPFLGLIVAIFAGMISGFVVAFLQTKMGIDSLLAGIVVNTGLYSINMLIMGGSATLNLNMDKEGHKLDTIFSIVKRFAKGTIFDRNYKLILIAIIVILIVLILSAFLRTRLGIAIRATGDNQDMVKSSSINPAFTTIIGLVVANSFTALSGCLLAEYQKSVDINIGTGMVTIALASLLIGTIIVKKGKLIFRMIAVIVGALIFRLIYTIALMLNMPSYMLKIVSSIIVIIVISSSHTQYSFKILMKRLSNKNSGGKVNA